MNSPTEHPLAERLADYLADRLSPDEAATVQRHLDTCEECVADLHFARSLRARAVEQGEAPGIEATVHLLERRIAELSDRGVSPTRVEQRHLDQCESCSAELTTLRSITPPDEVLDAIPVAAPTPVRRKSWVPAWSFGLLATAAALILLVGPWRDAGVDVPSLAVVEPMPVRITRGETSNADFDSARRAGLEAYAQSNFATATTQLRIAHRIDPTPEISLYLGSALLLDGDAETAVEVLDPVASGPDELLAEEARWQLANAHLTLDQPDHARPLLQHLADANAGRARQAQSLLDQLD